jgi:hypothetical protein
MASSVKNPLWQALQSCIAWVCVLLLLLPASVADSGGTLLYAQGSVLVNGKAVTDSIALFPGNTVQTGVDSSASITLAGSTLMLSANSRMTFQPDTISLQEGAVTVGTSSRISLRDGCLKVTPVGTNWTKYEVVDLTKLAKVTAQKESITVESTSGLTASSRPSGAAAATLNEGQETRSDKTCAPSEHRPYWIYGAAAGAAGGFLAWILLRCDAPVSPSTPASPSGSNCN